MPGTAPTALPSFFHDQHHETDAAKWKGGYGMVRIIVRWEYCHTVDVFLSHLFNGNNFATSVALAGVWALLNAVLFFCCCQNESCLIFHQFKEKMPFSVVCNGNFPGEPVLAGFTGAKDDEDGGDSWSCKTCKSAIKSSSPTNQHPTFYRPDALPVAQPTVSKH